MILGLNGSWINFLMLQVQVLYLNRDLCLFDEIVYYALLFIIYPALPVNSCWQGDFQIIF